MSLQGGYMFISIRNMLINFSLVTAIRRDVEASGVDEKTYLIIIDFDNESGWQLKYDTEVDRDKSYSDLLKWAGTINPNNMIP